MKQFYNSLHIKPEWIGMIPVSMQEIFSTLNELVPFTTTYDYRTEFSIWLEDAKKEGLITVDEWFDIRHLMAVKFLA